MHQKTSVMDQKQNQRNTTENQRMGLAGNRRNKTGVRKNGVRKTGVRKTGVRKNGVRKNGVRKTGVIWATREGELSSRDWGASNPTQGAQASSKPKAGMGPAPQENEKCPAVTGGGKAHTRDSGKFKASRILPTCCVLDKNTKQPATLAERGKAARKQLL